MLVTHILLGPSEATSKNNITVRTQLEDKIFIYSHKRINTLHYTGLVLQD